MITAALGMALVISETAMVARKSPICTWRMRKSPRRVAAFTLYNPRAPHRGLARKRGQRRPTHERRIEKLRLHLADRQMGIAIARLNAPAQFLGDCRSRGCSG